MQSYTFSENPEQATIAVLIKDAAFNPSAVDNFYVKRTTVPEERFAIIGLFYNNKNKVTAAEGKAYITKLLDALSGTNIRTLLVADSNYFKFLTGKQKVKDSRGYVLPCSIKGFEEFKVVLSTNYMAISHNPNHAKDLSLSLKVLSDNYEGKDKVMNQNSLYQRMRIVG